MNQHHGLSKTRLHGIYSGMKRRCCNENDNNYKNYGGRGITICNEWLNDFLEFYKWAMNNGYSDNLVIDRRNNDGNYEPSNCRFVNNFESLKNRRIPKTNTSGYRGVYYHKTTKLYLAIISDDSKRVHLGKYYTPQVAAYNFNKYIIDHRTSHHLNILPENIDEYFKKENEITLINKRPTTIGVCGEKNVNSKLTSKEVSEIRALYALNIMTDKRLAEMYNITRPNIYYIVNKKTWNQEIPIPCF
jgi:hypothetical protein